MGANLIEDETIHLLLTHTPKNKNYKHMRKKGNKKWLHAHSLCL